MHDFQLTLGIIELRIYIFATGKIKRLVGYLIGWLVSWTVNQYRIILLDDIFILNVPIFLIYLKAHQNLQLRN